MPAPGSVRWVWLDPAVPAGWVAVPSRILSSKLPSGPGSCPVPGAGLRYLEHQPGPEVWLKNPRLAGDGERHPRGGAGCIQPGPEQPTATLHLVLSTPRPPLPHGASAAHHCGVLGVSWGMPETPPGAAWAGGERVWGFWGYLGPVSYLCSSSVPFQPPPSRPWG